jgi:hypothetical protein
VTEGLARTSSVEWARHRGTEHRIQRASDIPENFLDIISNTHALFCKRMETNLSFLFPSSASFSLEDGHPFNEMRDGIHSRIWQ